MNLRLIAINFLDFYSYSLYIAISSKKEKTDMQFLRDAILVTTIALYCYVTWWILRWCALPLYHLAQQVDEAEYEGHGVKTVKYEWKKNLYLAWRGGAAILITMACVAGVPLFRFSLWLRGNDAFYTLCVNIIMVIYAIELFICFVPKVYFFFFKKYAISLERYYCLDSRSHAPARKPH